MNALPREGFFVPKIGCKEVMIDRRMKFEYLTKALRTCRIMAFTLPCQGRDTGSIPVTCSTHPMDFSDLIKKRRACHHFLPGIKIPDEDFLRMIEETSLTPSGYNAQPWEFVIIRKLENLAKIHELGFEQSHIKDASAVILVLADTEIGRRADQIVREWVDGGYITEPCIPEFKNSIAKVRSPEKKKMMALRSTMLAAMTLIYSAENMGYATCPIMGFSQWEVEEFLNIPKDRVIALMIALGKADGSKALPRLPRKKPEEMVHWERFEGKN